MKKKKLNFENFVQLENAEAVKVNGGGTDDPTHTLTFCYSIELEECITMEGKYCGTSYVEVYGPTNPWD